VKPLVITFAFPSATRRPSPHPPSPRSMPPAPRFCDVTGEALNDAAFELTRAATSSSYVDARAPSDDSPLRRIPRVVVDSGRWKYVLAQVRVEGRDDEAVLVVRALRGTTWHADNFARLREEMRASATGMENAFVAFVVGGGRIERDDEAKTMSVYGYSKTFGRCPGCNERTAIILREAFPEYETTWRDDGY
jgi:phosphohistidine phosphatase